MATHPYWTPPRDYRIQKSLLPVAHNLGFQFALPWPLPSTAGPYFGQNPQWGRRELVTSALPEWFAVDGIIPSTANQPLMNPYTAEMRFSRAEHTKRV